MASWFSSFFSFCQRWPDRRILHVVTTGEATRGSALQALLLALVLAVLERWPVDSLYWFTLIDHPGWMDFTLVAWISGYALTVALAVLGLLRRTWASRLTGAIVLAFAWPRLAALPWMEFLDPHPAGTLLSTVFAWTLGEPLTWIWNHAYADPVLAVPASAAYLFGLWLALRPGVFWASRRIVARAPAALLRRGPRWATVDSDLAT